MTTDVRYTIGADCSKYERAIDRVKSSTNSAGRVVKGAFGAAAVTLLGAAAGFAALAKQSLGVADNIHKLNLRLGVSTEALSQYQLVAETSGVEFNTLTMGFQRMQRRISEAAQGTGVAKDALAELGLSAQQLNQLKPDAQFEAIADAMAQVEGESNKTRLAMKLFDSGGVALLQTMTAGADGIRDMRQQADNLGMTLSQKGADDIAAFNDAMAMLTASTKGLAQTTMVQLAPILTEVANWLGANLPAAVNYAIEAYNWLSKTSVSVVRGVTSGLIGFYAVLGRLPGAIGQPYRDAAASLRDFRADLEAFQAYQLEVMDTSKSIAGNVNGAGGQLDFAQLPGVDERLKSQSKAAQQVAATDEKLRQEKLARELDFLNATQQAELEYDQRKLQHLLEQANAEYEIQDEAERKKAALEKRSQDAAASASGQALDAMLSVAQSKNKQLFQILKAAAIAKSIVSTYSGAAQALDDYAYPYNLVVAASIIAYGMAQVAKISSTSFNGSSAGASGTPTSASPGSITNPATGSTVDTGPVVSGQQESGGTLTINIHGDIMNEDFVDSMVEKINEASDRDVYINQSNYARDLR
jgi:hypothetical protein